MNTSNIMSLENIDNLPDVITPGQEGHRQAHEDLHTGVKALRAEVASKTPDLAPGWTQKWFGGSIRNMGASGGYWQPISDGAHWPWGINRVETTTTTIDIYYNEEFSGIGTVMVSCDETLSKEGWSAGASVEKGKCSLKLARYKSIADHVTWDGTKWTSGSGVFTPTWSTSSGGMLVLTHEKMFGHSYSVVPRGYGAVPVIATAGASDPAVETRISFFNPTTGAQIATTAELPANTRIYVTRSDAFKDGAINPQSAPDQISLPNSNIWLLGVHHVARPGV